MCYTVWCSWGCAILQSGSWVPTYRKHVFPACTLLHFYPEDGGSMFLREVDTHLPDYTVSYLRSPNMVLYFKSVVSKNVKRYSNPITGLDRPWGFQEAETSRISKQSAHEKVVALWTGRLYPPRDIPGTHFCWRLSRPQGHSAAGRIMSMENSNDTLWNRTCGLPACTAVLQPTASPRVPIGTYDC